MDKRTLSIIALLLVIGLLVAVIWGFGKAQKAKELARSEANVTQELQQMTLLRDGLAQEVENLSASYTDLAQTNAELEGSLANTQEELKRVNAALSRAKKTNANDKEVAFEMRKQIEDLIAVRSDLERSINVIKTENDSLRNRTVVLETQLGTSRSENEALANLNRSMQVEIEKLTLENFKATAFQVELTKGRNDRVTAKGRRARRIAVSFDLAGVPEEYQGVRPLYLVVTDAKGTPITSEKTIPVKAEVNGQTMNLMAIATREVNVEESQRLNMVHELDQKLDAGFYRAQVFTDIGLLGASSFRLR
ncbi:MAG: hypothetical protein AAFU67_04260 [Bacteroidota bacterium]